jgi:hypothetical protein
VFAEFKNLTKTCVFVLFPGSFLLAFNKKPLETAKPLMGRGLY